MSNEKLAAIILKHDKSAKDWVFNFYCQSCARYLYPEDLANGTCKRCKAKTENAIGHAIPFLTSATALEKLIVWVKSRAIRDPHLHAVLVHIQSITNNWLHPDTSLTVSEYRELVVDAVAAGL